MTCQKCSAAAPENLVAFPGTPWLCDKCNKPTETVGSKLLAYYTSGFPGRYCYISEFSNNLDKVHKFLTENAELTNQFCTITFVMPEGINKLHGSYDGVFVDKQSLTDDEILSINRTQFASVVIIDPTTQEVIDA